MSTIRWLCVCWLQAVLYSYFFCIVFVFHYRNKQRQTASKRWGKKRLSTRLSLLNWIFTVFLCFALLSFLFVPFVCFAFKASPGSVMTVSATCKGCHRLTKLINRSLVPCSFSQLDLNQLFASHFAICLICLHLINQQSSVELQWRWQCPRRGGGRLRRRQQQQAERSRNTAKQTAAWHRFPITKILPVLVLCVISREIILQQAILRTPLLLSLSISLSLCLLATNCNGK